MFLTSTLIGITLFAVDPDVVIDASSAPVHSLAFSPDGKRVIAGGADRKVRSWDAKNGERVSGAKSNPKVLKTHSFASVGRNRRLFCLNDVRSYEESLKVKEVLSANQVVSISSLSADGLRALAWTKGKNKKLKLVVIDTETNTVLRELAWKGETRAGAALSPDGMLVAVVSAKILRLFDVASGEERTVRFSVPKGVSYLTASPYIVSFSSDGSRIAVVDGSTRIRVVDSKNGETICQFDETVWNGVESFSDVALSQDGKTLAIGKHFGAIDIWEVATSQLVRYQRGDSLLFCPDNRKVAILQGNTISVHDMYDTSLLLKYKSPSDLTGDLVFSPNGNLLAASCVDKWLRIWNVTTPKKKVQPLGKATLKQLWTILVNRASPDPQVEAWKEKAGAARNDIEEGKSARAYKAIGRLIADPDRSIPFLKAKLTFPPLNDNKISKWIVELDSNSFAKRKAAFSELSKAGIPAIPAIRNALKLPASVEQHARLKKLLMESEIKQQRFELAATRAIQVVEHVGNKESRQLLKLLKKQDLLPSIRSEARQALARNK